MREKIIVVCIIFLAAFLRFYNLVHVPASLSHDEVAIGYNAWSILHTGRDEYGISFPLLFRSFDDYKLPGIVYATVASEFLFGLNEFSVRLPSALFGTLAVLIFYLIISNFLKNNFVTILRYKVSSAHIITFFFAVSMWHINFSRQSFESNGSLFFLILGVYFLLKFRDKPMYIFFSSISFAISIYFYYSVRVILPFILLTFLIVYKKEILKQLKIIILAALVGILLLAPFLPSLFSSGGFARISTVSVTNDANYIQKKEQYTKIIVENDTVANRILFNRRVALVNTVIDNYLKNISLRHLFLSGTGFLGLLYIFELPFFFLGMYSLSSLQSRFKWVLITWFFSATLAGAFTTQQPNSLRTLPNAPMFSLLSGLGFVGIANLFRDRTSKNVFIVVSSIIFTFFFIQFLYRYFYEQPRVNSLHFGDGYKQMVHYLKENEEKYDKIYITGHYWRPYIFILFWQQYDPAKYQEGGIRDHFDKYYFGKAEWDNEGLSILETQDLNNLTDSPAKTLFFLSPKEYAKHSSYLKKQAVINGRHAKDIFIAATIE